jgi:hypothetical protein
VSPIVAPSKIVSSGIIQVFRYLAVISLDLQIANCVSFRKQLLANAAMAASRREQHRAGNGRVSAIGSVVAYLGVERAWTIAQDTLNKPFRSASKTEFRLNEHQKLRKIFLSQEQNAL